jgi:hypothetical protein
MGQGGDFFTSGLLLWTLGCILIVSVCGLLIRAAERRFSLRARAIGRVGAGVMSIMLLLAEFTSYAVDVDRALTLLVRLDVQRLTTLISASLALLTFNTTISYLVSTVIAGLLLDRDT